MSDKRTIEKRAGNVSKKVARSKGKIDTEKENLSGILHDISERDENAVDLSPQIAKRAYELYELRGRQEGLSVQDWGQAERDIRKQELY